MRAVYDAGVSRNQQRTVRLGRDQDLESVTRTAMRAFYTDPVMRWLIPDDDDFEKSYQALFGDLARRWIQTETLWVTDDVVGFGGWQPPGRPDVVLAEDRVRLPNEDVEHPPDRIERFIAFRAMAAEQAPTEAHWYLSLLGTHPDWQRYGIGLALMREGFAFAHRDGLACYLETETIENVAYYQHHGFVVRSEWDLPLGGPHMWGMLRPH